MDDATMIDMHEDLVQNLQELRKDAPKIKEMYSSFQKELKKQNTILDNAIANAKTEINKAEISGTKKITELSTTRKQQIDACLKKLEEVVKRAEDLQETLGISVDSIQEFEERIEDFETDIESLKKEVKKQKSQYKKLEERLNLLEEDMNNEDQDEEYDEDSSFYENLNERLRRLEGNLNNEDQDEEYEDSDVDIDYDEVLPAVEVFSRYFHDIGYPIIIEKPNYKNDYCFRITGYDNATRLFSGDYYRAGKIYKRNSTFPYDVKCRMFHGSSCQTDWCTMSQILKNAYVN